MNKTETEQPKWYEKKARKHFTADGSFAPSKKSTTKKDRHFNDTNTNNNKAATPHSSHLDDTRAYHTYNAHSVHNAAASLTSLNSLFSTKTLPHDAEDAIASFDKIISSAHPISSKQRALLPQQIRSLSHELTDERSDRRLGYMNQTTTLSAYVYYYMWWNLVRLTRLFSNLPADSFTLADDAICLDIGSGPLTVPVALFLARPELRKKKLTWYCLDLSSSALAEGENIFLSVAAYLKCEPWKIIRVKGEMGTAIKEKVSLVTCANVFNEIVEDATMPPDYLAKKYCEKILSYVPTSTTSSSTTHVLVIEPGVPKSARFISLLRDALDRRGFSPDAPCTHCGVCPMDGKRGGKWCNFAFSTDDAPNALKKLSEQSQLPKERAVLSFIMATRKQSSQIETETNNTSETLSFRITSDPIRLPGERTGFYACSEKGLLLVVSSHHLFSGESFKIKTPDSMDHIDAKSGAIVIDL